MATRLGAILVLGLIGCGVDLDDRVRVPVLEPPNPGEGIQFKLTGVTVEPYSEAWLCSVYEMPTSSTAFVNWARHLQNPDMHHMTLSAILERGSLPYGISDCNDLYANSALMEGAVIFYGSQGASDDEMHLPEGIAAPLPATIDVLHEVHFVNAYDEPVELYSYVNGYTIPEALVTDMIWGGSVRDEHIQIPAQATHTEWSRCVFNRDVEVLFLSSHTHGLGTNFEIKRFDGTNVGATVYTNTDWHSPSIVQYDPPMVVPAGQGFEWTCTWRNDSAEPITYGLKSTDEMCNLAVVHTPFDLGAACEVVETSDGVLWAP